MDFLKKMMNKDIELGDTLVEDLSKITEARKNRAIVVEYKGANDRLFVVALSKDAKIAMIYDHDDQLSIESRMMWGTDSIYSDFVDSAARISRGADNNRYQIFVNTFSHAPAFVDYLTVIYRDYTIQKAYELTQAYDVFDSIEERNIYDIKEEDIVKMTFFNQSVTEMAEEVIAVSDRLSTAEDKITPVGAQVNPYELILSDPVGLDSQEDTDKLIMAAANSGEHSLSSVKTESTGFLWADVLERTARANERGWLKLSDPKTGEPVASFAAKEKPVPDYSHKSKVITEDESSQAGNQLFADNSDVDTFEDDFNDSSEYSEPHDESEIQMAAEIIARSVEENEGSSSSFEDNPDDASVDVVLDEDEVEEYMSESKEEEEQVVSEALSSSWKEISDDEEDEESTSEEIIAEEEAEHHVDENDGSEETRFSESVSSEDLLLSFDEDDEEADVEGVGNEESEDDSEDEHVSVEEKADGDKDLYAFFEDDETVAENLQDAREEGDTEESQDKELPVDEDEALSDAPEEDAEEESDEVSDITVEEDINYEVEGNDLSSPETDDDTSIDEETSDDDDVFTVVVHDDEDDYDDEENEEKEKLREYRRRKNSASESEERESRSLPIIDPSDVSTFSVAEEVDSTGKTTEIGELKLERQKYEDFSEAFEDLIREKHSAQSKLDSIPHQEHAYIEELKHLNGNLDNVTGEIVDLEGKLEEARVAREEAIWEYDRLSSQLDERHSAAVKSRHRVSQVSILLEKLETERMFYSNSVQSADVALERAKQKQPSAVSLFLEALESFSEKEDSDNVVVAEIVDKDIDSTDENHTSIEVTTFKDKNELEDVFRITDMEDEGGGVIPSAEVNRNKFRGDYIAPDASDSKELEEKSSDSSESS